MVPVRFMVQPDIDRKTLRKTRSDDNYTFFNSINVEYLIYLLFQGGHVN